jgi:hypothetical protein
MSRSEGAALVNADSAAVAEAVSDLTRKALHDSGAVDIDVDDLRRLVSSVTQLYAACCQSVGHEIAAIDNAVSTTDAVMLACALLRACGLNPFDLALWFSSGFGDPGANNQEGLS